MRKAFVAGLILVMLMLFCAPALAGHGVYHVSYADEAPQKVIKSLESRWKGYVLEDYLFLNGPNPDVGLALVEKKGHRVLAVYRMKDNEMSFWYSTDDAVPQGTGEAWFDETGEQVYKEGYGWVHVGDGMGFGVTRYDLLGEMYNQYAEYRWKDDGFHLTGFYDVDVSYETADVKDGMISYYGYGEGDSLGKVFGEIQTDLRYVSFAKLPKTIKEAKNELTVAPDDLPTGKILGSGGSRLTAKEVKFTGGRNYPVYLGPGKQYMRSGNGKGAVSTNDWIQVFGKYEGWIMIQYDISAERYRIGWIEASALPSGANVPEIELKMLDNDDYGEVIDQCVLTDDPFNSESPIATLKPGTPVCEIVYNMGGWSYIRVTIDGVDVCGFVLSDCISHG